MSRFCPSGVELYSSARATHEQEAPAAGLGVLEVPGRAGLSARGGGEWEVLPFRDDPRAGRSLASLLPWAGGAMRNWAVLLLMGTVGCTGCSGGETPPSPDEDAVRDGGIWSPDRGPGIEVLERGRSLPPAHLASVDELRPDSGPGPFSDMRVHVDLSGTVRTVPCAVPSGSYCDGFAVVDASGASIAVDTYSYLGAKPACRSRWAEGARVASVSGVWQQRAAGPSALSVLAPSSCDDLDGPSPVEGTPAPSSDEVHQLVTGWVPGRLISVRGVVTARWKSSSGAFGLAMQDPGGSASSGVRLVRSRTSSVPASAPEVGDWIRVTARTARDGEHLLEL